MLSNSACEPTSTSGTLVTGMIHANRSASPWYWIWMCAVTVPSLMAKAMRSPACTMGTLGSGGVKQPHAEASVV
jgi:hypothetical protein